MTPYTACEYNIIKHPKDTLLQYSKLHKRENNKIGPIG